MSTMKDTLTADMRASMKARTNDKTSLLRTLLGDIATQEKAGKTAKEFTDADVITFLQKEAKKRRDTAAIYAGAGVQDRADRELAEVALIESYLPAGLTDAEVEALVDAEIAKVEDASMKNMGGIVKAVLAAAGGGTDGKTVSALVRARLS